MSITVQEVALMLGVQKQKQDYIFNFLLISNAMMVSFASWMMVSIFFFSQDKGSRLI